MLGRVQCTKFDCFGQVGTFHFLSGGWGVVVLQRSQRCRQKNNPSDFIRPLSSRVYYTRYASGKSLMIISFFHDIWAMKTMGCVDQ